VTIERRYSSEFLKCFNGTIILKHDIETKLASKHKVYKDDLADALGDPYIVVFKTKQKSPNTLNNVKSKGKVYEILCETEGGRVLFIVGRLFPDGNLYIITAYWANSEIAKIYLDEREVQQNE